MFVENFNLKPFNTFGVSVNCKRYAAFRSNEELQELLKGHQIQHEPLLILGGGSNILFTRDYAGTVLHNHIRGIEVLEEKDQEVIVSAGGGENWHQFVQFCISKDWGGIENLSLIPGNVGASPMQNIGAYGVEIKDVFHSLLALHLPTGEVHTFDAKDCNFGYRESVFKNRFKNQYIILEVRYRLSKKHDIKTSYGAINTELEKAGINNPSIKDVSQAVIRIRQSKLPDPAEIGNAGSFFKNPVLETAFVEELKTRFPEMPAYPVANQPEKTKVAAGWLIEQAGLKGQRFGECGVHSKQALVLVNHGKAEGADILNLSQKVIDTVAQKFNIPLEREVNIV